MPHREYQLRQKPLSELASEKLLADIMSGRYAPGQRLSVDEIAEEFGISRTPVREAIQRLGTMQFVDVVRNSRTEVAHWGRLDMSQRLRLIGLIAVASSSESADMNFVVEHVSGANAQAADVHSFLLIVEQLIQSEFSKIAIPLIRDMISPLRQFFQPLSLERLRIDPSLSAERRFALLQNVHEQLSSGTDTQKADAIAQYLDAVGKLLEVEA